MTTIVDLDTGQVLGIVDGRDSEGVGNWLFARPLEGRLGVQVVAIDPSAVFRKALRMWLPRTAVSVDAFHLVKLGNDMLTGVRQRLTQQTHDGTGHGPGPGQPAPAATGRRCALGPWTRQARHGLQRR
jgi:transposase